MFTRSRYRRWHKSSTTDLKLDRKQGRNLFALTFSFRYHNGYYFSLALFPPSTLRTSPLSRCGRPHFSLVICRAEGERPRRPQRATYPPFVTPRTLVFVSINERTIHKELRERLLQMRKRYRCLIIMRTHAAVFTTLISRIIYTRELCAREVNICLKAMRRWVSHPTKFSPRKNTCKYMYIAYRLNLPIKFLIKFFDCKNHKI